MLPQIPPRILVKLHRFRFGQVARNTPALAQLQSVHHHRGVGSRGLFGTGKSEESAGGHVKNCKGIAPGWDPPNGGYALGRNKKPAKAVN